MTREGQLSDPIELARLVDMDDIKIQIQLGDDETTLWRSKGAKAARFRAEYKRLGRWLIRETGRVVEIMSTPEHDVQYAEQQRHLLWSGPRVT